MPPPWKIRKHFLTRYTVQNGISNLHVYILLKSALKMQFQRPKFQNIFGGACPRTPLQFCRHYGLPITKILATPLPTCTAVWSSQHFKIWNISCISNKLVPIHDGFKISKLWIKQVVVPDKEICRSREVSSPQSAPRWICSSHAPVVASCNKTKFHFVLLCNY